MNDVILPFALPVIVFALWVVLDTSRFLKRVEVEQAERKASFELMQPIFDYLELLKQSGQRYSEEGFAAYLAQRGIDIGSWQLMIRWQTGQLQSRRGCL